MAEEEKTVFTCLRCDAEFRIPEKGHVNAKCPTCQESFAATNGVLKSSFGLNYETKFATFWQRLLARCIDTVVPSVLFGSTCYYIRTQPESVDVTDSGNIESVLGMCFYFLLYYPILDSLGGTVGKKAIGIKSVLKSSLQTPTVLETYFRSLFLLSPLVLCLLILAKAPFNGEDAYLNYVSTLLSVFLLLIYLLVSPLAMLWSKTNQGLHDKNSNIIVIQNVREVDSLLERKKQTNYNFS